MNLSKPNPTLVEVLTTEVAEKRIDPISGHRSLFSLRSFEPGECIHEFSAKATHSTPNYLTVQLAENKHIELYPEYLECINHSCDPNCMFDTTRMELVALQHIEPGDEFVFFYPSAEWDMDQPFQCHCGRLHCLGMIGGARYLSRESVNKYEFTDFIKSKFRR